MIKENVKVISEDGSHTLFSGEFKEHYHSTHGAIQESRHIFVQAGYHFIREKFQEINILEIGFGTGLNALLTCLESESLQIFTRYTALEPFPLDPELIKGLNYPSLLPDSAAQQVFQKLHDSEWESGQTISRYFNLEKLKTGIQEWADGNTSFHLIYFDAFSPDTQPEMWTEAVFARLFNQLRPGGCLVTYSCKGVVKRALRPAGFLLHKLPGPPGKREILRAIKPEKSSE